MPKRPLISLFTDASLCGRTKAAGWGFWARRGDRIERGGAGFGEPIETSNEAEICAVANSLITCTNRGLIGANMHTLIQLDNDHVVRTLDTRTRDPMMRELEKFAKNTIIAHAKKVGFSFSVRHVKGHSPDLGPGNYVNDLADTIAKRHMHEKRKEAQRASL